jgi:hypothetical protein
MDIDQRIVNTNTHGDGSSQKAEERNANHYLVSQFSKNCDGF